MVRRYKVDTRDGIVGIVEMLPGVDYSAINSREYVHADDYDALEAEWMALSQDDGKVERALESAQARVRELEAAFNAWAGNCDCQCTHCERMANRFWKPSQSDRGSK